MICCIIGHKPSELKNLAETRTESYYPVSWDPRLSYTYTADTSCSRCGVHYIAKEKGRQGAFAFAFLLERYNKERSINSSFLLEVHKALDCKNYDPFPTSDSLKADILKGVGGLRGKQKSKTRAKP